LQTQHLGMYTRVHLISTSLNSSEFMTSGACARACGGGALKCISLTETTSWWQSREQYQPRWRIWASAPAFSPFIFEHVKQICHSLASKSELPRYNWTGCVSSKCESRKWGRVAA
jgi:hypothetical protein